MYVLVDLDMGGRRVAAGEIVVAVLGAVDCDPALSPNPTGWTWPACPTATSPLVAVSTSAWGAAGVD